MHFITSISQPLASVPSSRRKSVRCHCASTSSLGRGTPSRTKKILPDSGMSFSRILQPNSPGSLWERASRRRVVGHALDLGQFLSDRPLGRLHVEAVLQIEPECAEVPSALLRRRAVSALMPLVSDAMRSTRVRGTPIAFASAPGDSPSGTRNSSRRISPGWRRVRFLGTSVVRDQDGILDIVKKARRHRCRRAKHAMRQFCFCE